MQTNEKYISLFLYGNTSKITNTADKKPLHLHRRLPVKDKSKTIKTDD